MAQIIIAQKQIYLLHGIGCAVEQLIEAGRLGADDGQLDYRQ